MNKHSQHPVLNIIFPIFFLIIFYSHAAYAEDDVLYNDVSIDYLGVEMMMPNIMYKSIDYDFISHDGKYWMRSMFIEKGFSLLKEKYSEGLINKYINKSSFISEKSNADHVSISKFIEAKNDSYIAIVFEIHNKDLNERKKRLELAKNAIDSIKFSKAKMALKEYLPFRFFAISNLDVTYRNHNSVTFIDKSSDATLHASYLPVGYKSLVPSPFTSRSFKKDNQCESYVIQNEETHMLGYRSKNTTITQKCKLIKGVVKRLSSVIYLRNKGVVEIKTDTTTTDKEENNSDRLYSKVLINIKINFDKPINKDRLRIGKI